MPKSGAPALKVSHVILRVAEMARSVAFYRDRVGLPLLYSSGEFAAFDGGGVTLLLNQPDSPEPAPPSAGLAALTEVVLEAADVAAAHAALVQRGIAFRVVPRVVTSDGQRDLLAADFRDPDGHVLSITGWVPRTPA